MDASKPKKKRSELELLLGHAEVGNAAFSARLPALSISSPSAPDGTAESDEQIARRLHEELNGTRITRRGSKAAPEDHLSSSPTSARGMSSPHARPKAEVAAGAKAGMQQAPARMAPPSQPPTPASEAPSLPSAPPQARAGTTASDSAADAAVGVETAAEVVKRKRNTVPARELHLLLQQASSTSGRAEAALSPTRSTRGTTHGGRMEPPATLQTMSTAGAEAGGNPTGPSKGGAGNATRSEPNRAQIVTATPGAVPAVDNSSSARTAPATTASLARPPPPPLPPRLKQRFLAGVMSPSGSAPPALPTGRPALPSTSDNGKRCLESAGVADASCTTLGAGRTAIGGAAGHAAGSVSAVTPSALLGAARDSLLSGMSLEGCSMQSHCQSNAGHVAAVPSMDPGSSTVALQTSAPPLSAAATGASIGGCSSTDETENDLEAEAAAGAAGAVAPSATSPKADPLPLQPQPRTSGRESAAALSAPSTAGGSAAVQGAEAGAPPSGGQQSGPLKVPKLPMIRAGRAWYRGRLIRESSDGARVLVEVPGAPANQGSGTQQQPFWLPATSDRIWRGSYKGKDWRYLGDGAWEPKPGAFKRGKQGSSSNGLPLPLPSWAVEGAATGPQSVEDPPASRSKRERERERTGLKEEAPADAPPQLQPRVSREGPTSRSQRSQRRSTTPAPAPEPATAAKDSAVPSVADEVKTVSGTPAAPITALKPPGEVAVQVKDEAADTTLEPQVAEPSEEAPQPPLLAAAVCAGGSASSAAEAEGRTQCMADAAGVAEADAIVAAAGAAEAGNVAEEPVETSPQVVAAEASIVGPRKQANNAGQASDANPDVDSPVMVEPASNVTRGRSSDGGKECEGRGEGAAAAVGGEDDDHDDGVWVPGVPHPRTRMPRRARARQQRLRTPLDGLQRLFGHPHGELGSGDESAGEGEGAEAAGANAGTSDAELGPRRGSGDGTGVSYLVGRRRAAARAAAVAAAAARAEAEAEEEELEEILLGRRPPRRDKFNHVHGLYHGGVAAKRNHHQHHYHHSSHHRSRSGARADSNLHGDSSGGLDDVSMGDGGQGNAQSGRQRGGRSHSQPAVDYGTTTTSNGQGWEAGTWQQHGGAHARGRCAAGGAQGHAAPRNRRKGKPCRSRMDGEGEPWCCWDDDYEQQAAGGVWARMPEALRQLYYLPTPAAGGGADSSGRQQQPQVAAVGEEDTLGGKGSREQGYRRSSGGGSYYGAPPHKRRRVYDESLAAGSPDEVEADDAEGDADYRPPYGNTNRRSSVIGGRRCSANGTSILHASLPGRHGLWVTDQIHHRPLYSEPQRLTVANRAASAPISAIAEMGCVLDPLPPRRHILVSCGAGGGWTVGNQTTTLTSGVADPRGSSGILGGGTSSGAGCMGVPTRRSIPSGLAGLLEAALGHEAVRGGDGLAETHPAQSEGQHMLQSDCGGGGLEAAARVFGLGPKREVLGAAGMGGELLGGGGASQQRQESHHAFASMLAPQVKDTHAAHVALSDSSVNHCGEGEAVGAEGKAVATTPATARADGAILRMLEAGVGSGTGATAPSGCPSGCPSPPAIQPLPLPYSTGGALAAAIAGGSLSPTALQLRPGTPTRARRTGRPPSMVLGAGAPLPKLPALSSSASVRLQAAAASADAIAAAGDPAAVAAGATGVLPSSQQHLDCNVIPASSCDQQQPTPAQPYSALQHGRRSHDAALYGTWASPDLDPMEDRPSHMRIHGASGAIESLASGVGGDVADPSGPCAEVGLWHAGSEGPIIAQSVPSHPQPPPPLPISSESSVGALSSAPSAGGPLGCGSDAAALSALGFASAATGGCSPVGGLRRRVSSCGLGTVSDAPAMPMAAALGPGMRGAGGGGGGSSGCGVMDALEVLLLEQQPVMRQLAVQAQMEVDNISFASALTSQQQQSQSQHHRGISRQLHSCSSMDEQQAQPQEQQVMPVHAQRSGSMPDGLLAALPSVEVVVNLFSTRTAPYGSAQQALADMVGGAAAIPLFQ